LSREVEASAIGASGPEMLRRSTVRILSHQRIDAVTRQPARPTLDACSLPPAPEREAESCLSDQNRSLANAAQNQGPFARKGHCVIAELYILRQASGRSDPKRTRSKPRIDS